MGTHLREEKRQRYEALLADKKAHPDMPWSELYPKYHVTHSGVQAYRRKLEKQKKRAAILAGRADPDFAAPMTVHIHDTAAPIAPRGPPSLEGFTMIMIRTADLAALLGAGHV